MHSSAVHRGIFTAFLIFFSITAGIAESQSSALPHGYTTIQLGMSLDEVKSALYKNGDFGYRGDRDVSLLPGENRTLIETQGFGTLNECWFQFQDEALFSITININQDVMDYYSVFSTLCGKYGNPQELNPAKCTWRDDDVVMTLEKPLTIKYVDAKRAAQLAGDSSVEAASVEIVRRMFLDAL